MSTYTKILYHIVFSTKDRKRTLKIENREKILKYIWGIIKNKKCYLYQINLMEDHIHILCSLHPSMQLAELVKSIKLSVSDWLKRENISPDFVGWQSGYGAFTLSWSDKKKIVEYIKNQQEHHKLFDFKTEYKKLLDESGIEYDEKYLS
jgi:putative transposase